MIEQIYIDESVALLRRMISTPSHSREEGAVADLLQDALTRMGILVNRHGNNVWARTANHQCGRPTILLCAHTDTVKPAAGYTRDPYEPALEGDILWGLGSNDDGGSAVALLAAFRHFYGRVDLPFNLILALTAEEEVSGKNGIESLLPTLGLIDCGIVGEPTSLRMAVAERGLMVLDCIAGGKSGHAARNEGINAIYNALPAIEWFRMHQWPRISAMLGPVKMTVTQINAGTQHNVVPDTCAFVVDVRVNELYKNKELLDLVRAEVGALPSAMGCPTVEVRERSTRLNPSGISSEHPLVRSGLALGLQTFGSPTLSDQALLPFPTVKIGPGDSARSHTADEFIKVSEIAAGAATYVALLERVGECY